MMAMLLSHVDISGWSSPYISSNKYLALQHTDNHSMHVHACPCMSAPVEEPEGGGRLVVGLAVQGKVDVC